MNKLIATILLFCTFSMNAMALCDWTKITAIPADNTFIYPEEEHLCVGQLVQDDKVKDQQIADYKQAVNLDEDALAKADQRTQLWINSTTQIQDKLNQYQANRSSNEWLFYAGGILTAVLVGFATAKLAGR